VKWLRLVGVSWLLRLKAASRSAFDGLLMVVWPLFYVTTVLLLYRSGPDRGRVLAAAVVGSSVMALWSAVSTTAAYALQTERRQRTLELLTVAPAPFALVMFPVALAMATVGLFNVAFTLLWGRLVFGVALVIARPGPFAAGILVTCLAVGMLGYLESLASVRYRSAWALGNALELPIWLICGFLVPLSLMPGWLRPVAWALAPTWGMDAIRAAVNGGPVAADLGVCLALVAGYALIGLALSRWLLTSARVHASLTLS